MRVLAVGAHPDDVEILAGGTLARYRQQGYEVGVCVLTDGSLGGDFPMGSEPTAVRWREAKDAAAVIGAPLYWEGFPDGHLIDSVEPRHRLAATIRNFRPTILLTHSSSDYHPDHRAASAITLGARLLATEPQFLPNTEPLPQVPRLVWMDTLSLLGDDPTVWIDITDTFQTKLKMLEKHASQVFLAEKTDGHSYIELIDRQARARGMQCGVDYAEAFTVAPLFPITPQRIL